MNTPMNEPKKAMVELKEVLGALIFGSNRPLSINDLRKCVVEVAQEHGKEAKVFESVKPGDIKKAVQALQRDLEKTSSGLLLREVLGGFRFQTDPRCGPWLKSLLDHKKPNRLSRPGLETLAIIAYRQPMTRAEIERIRGVGVDHVMKALMEAQLIRIVGRSELPGRPFLYGTTQLFLEHFGLKSLDDLRDKEILSLIPEDGDGPAVEGDGDGGVPGADSAQDAETTNAGEQEASSADVGAEEPDDEEEEYDDDDDDDDEDEDDDAPERTGGQDES